MIPAPGNDSGANGSHLVLVGAPGGKVRALLQTKRAPTNNELFESMQLAMTRPGDNLTVARPARVLVQDARFAQVLGTPLAGCGVPVQVVASLPALFDTLQRVQERLRQRGWPTATGVAPAIETALCVQAARFAKAAPWERLLDRHAFLLHLDAGPWRTPVASVIGAAREVFGIILYKDFATFARHQAASHLDLPDANEMDALLVAFDQGREVPPDVRTAFAKARLPTVSDWHPIFTRMQPGVQPHAILDESEAALLADCLEALANLFDRHLRSMPDRRVEVTTASARGTRIRVETTFGEDVAAPPPVGLGMRPSQHIVTSLTRAFLCHALGLDLAGLPPFVRVPTYVIRAAKADAVALKHELANVDGLGFQVVDQGGGRSRAIAGMAGETLLGNLMQRPVNRIDDDFLHDVGQFGGRAVFLIIAGGTARRLVGIARKDVVAARVIRIVELP